MAQRARHIRGGSFYTGPIRILRGKIIPCDKFILSAVRMPESAIAQTVTGDWGEQEEYLDETDGDMQLRPDVDGCFVVPWARSRPVKSFAIASATKAA